MIYFFVLAYVFPLPCSLGGYPPFSEEIKKHTLNEQIIKGLYTFPKAYWKAVSPKGNYTSNSLFFSLFQWHYLGYSGMTLSPYPGKNHCTTTFTKKFLFLENAYCFFFLWRSGWLRFVRHDGRRIVHSIMTMTRK